MGKGTDVWWLKRGLYLHPRYATADIAPEQLRRIRVVTWTIGSVAVIGIPFIIQYWLLGLVWMSAAIGLTMLGGIASVMVVRHTGRAALGGWLGTTMLLVLLTVSNIASGGFYDPNFGWLYVVPILAALVVNPRAGWVFTGVVLAISVGFWIAPDLGLSMPSRIASADHAQQSLFNRLSAIVAIGVGLAALASQQRFAARLLEKANEDLREEMRQRQEASARLVHSERMASMGSVAASVAHEINNPLTYLLMNLAELRATARGDREIIDEAIGGAKRVQSLVDDLRTFSHGSDEEEPLTVVDVANPLALALRMVSNEMRHRARFTHEWPETGLAVMARESRLVQVILNLLTNAMHAIRDDAPGEISLRAETRETETGSEVVIEVTDTGEGMTPEVRLRAFEPFFTTKAIGVGTGLGLSICQNVVSAMNGRMTLDSHEGKGTKVQIILPSVVSRTLSHDVSGTHVKATTRRIRMLVVDDERAISRAVQRALKEHDVETAESGWEALKRCADTDYDLVLCDLMMPGLSGVDFHTELARRHPGMETRIVFMTGGVFTPKEVAFIDGHDNIVLHKPFNPDTLRQTVAEAVDERDAASDGSNG